jgi:GrpB-like predicted nucleotidyltransferase (UPF0157 family)
VSDEQGIIKGMRVAIFPYDPQWQRDFERVSRQLRAVLRKVDVLAIEHVGSTSVRGLPAKPVIDIDIVVDQDSLPHAVDALARLATSMRERRASLAGTPSSPQTPTPVGMSMCASKAVWRYATTSLCGIPCVGTVN